MLGRAEHHVRAVWMPNRYRTGMGTQSQCTKVKFVNFVAFMAKLTQANITNSSFLSLSYFRWGIEHEEKRCSSRREDFDVMVAASAVWIVYAGSCWCDKIVSGVEWRVFEPGRVMEQRYSLWSGDIFVVDLDRWALWKDPFRRISMGSVPEDI